MISFLIKFKGFTDVITNSSSEVFMLKDCINTRQSVNNILNYHDEHIAPFGIEEIDEWPDELKKLLNLNDRVIEELKMKYDGSSGDGGCVEVTSWQNAYMWYKKNVNWNATEEEWANGIGIPLEKIKNTIIVDVDKACYGTINYIMRNFTYDAEWHESFDWDLYYALLKGKNIEWED